MGRLVARHSNAMNHVCCWGLLAVAASGNRNRNRAEQLEVKFHLPR